MCDEETGRRWMSPTSNFLRDNQSLNASFFYERFDY